MSMYKEAFSPIKAAGQLKGGFGKFIGSRATKIGAGIAAGVVTVGSAYKGGEYKGKKELAGKFNAFNKKENAIIGSTAYRKGAQDAYNYLQKKSEQESLQIAEFSKEAGVKDTIKALLGASNSARASRLIGKGREYGGMIGNLAEDVYTNPAINRSVSDASSSLKNSFRNLGNTGRMAFGNQVALGGLKNQSKAKALLQGLLNSKAALGTTTAGGLGTAAAIKALLGKGDE